MDTSVQEGVCPVCGESLGDAMESDCARCGSHILVNKVTGLPVHVPQTPKPKPPAPSNVTAQVVMALLFFFVVLPLVIWFALGDWGGNGTGKIVILVVALVFLVVLNYLWKQQHKPPA